MSYDNPNRIMYTSPVDTDVSGADEYGFQGPKGKAGMIYDYGVVNVTTDTASDNGVSVGLVGGDTDAYAAVLACDVTAAIGGTSFREQHDMTSSASRTLIDALVAKGGIPKDVNFTVEVDGNGTGACQFFVIVDWED